MEIVAAERVKVDRLKPIDQGVNLITLHRVICSLKEVVELCDLCAKVVDVAGLLESVVGLTVFHSLFPFFSFQREPPWPSTLNNGIPRGFLPGS